MGVISLHESLVSGLGPMVIPSVPLGTVNRVALRPVWRSWRLLIRIIYTVCLYYGDPMVDSAVQSREKWLSSLSPLCVLRDLQSEDSAQCWNTV